MKINPTSTHFGKSTAKTSTRARLAQPFTDTLAIERRLIGSSNGHPEVMLAMGLTVLISLPAVFLLGLTRTLCGKVPLK